MNLNIQKGVLRCLLNRIQHYNHKSYWRMRGYVVDPNKKNSFLKCLYLYRIKKMDAFNNASMGTDYNGGAKFASPPVLLHGLNGIIVSHYAEIGHNCVIYQQVTIAQNNHQQAPKIGNHCVIGAGQKL